jgi:MFS family permease
VDRNLLLLSFGVAARMMGNALYAPFLVLSLYSVFRVGYVEIGRLIVLCGLLQVPCLLAGGLAADGLGRRRLILVGLAAESVFTAVLALALLGRSLELVLVDAEAAGMVGALTGPAFSAYISDHASGSARTQAFNWYRMAFNAGFSAGVTLGGLLVAFYGFAVAVGIAAAIIGSVALGLAAGLAPSPYDRRAVERRGRELPGEPPAARGVRGSLGRLAHDRSALELALAFALASFVASRWSVIFPLFVHNVLGVGYALLGAGPALNGLVVVVGQRPTTSWSIGQRHTTLAALGLSLYCAAFLSLGIVGSLGRFVGVLFLLAVVVLTIGENLLAIPASTLPSNLAPPDEVGSYNGSFQVFGQVGFLASTLLGGVVLASTSDPALIWLLLTAPAVPAVLRLRHAGGRVDARANTA